MKRLLAVLFTVFAGLVLAILAQSSAQAADNWSITGTLTDEETIEPIPGVDVYVYSADNNNYVGGASTDQDGNYTISALPQGQYKIEYRAPYGSEYLDEWFENETNFSSATIIDLIQDETVDAQLTTGLRITGSVTDEETDGPLPYVAVSVYKADQQYSSVASGYTDQDGNYSTGVLAPGDYKIQFNTYGSEYLSEWYQDKNDFASATTFNLTADSTIADAQLAKGLRISGTITDEKTDGPLTNVTVSVYKADDQNSGIVASGYISQDGAYSTSVLPPGDYKIQFGPQYGSEYLSEWYKDKNDFASATTFTLTDDNSTANAELAKGLRITGTVTDDKSNSPVSGVYVNVYKADNPLNFGVASGSTGQDGTYTTGALPPGEYKVRYDAGNTDYLGEWYKDQTDFSSATTITVTDSNETANAKLTKGLRITGTITDEKTNSAISGIGVSVYRKSDNQNSSVAYGSSGQDGTYTTSALPPGEYKIRYESWNSDYLGEWYEDQTDFNSATTITVTDSNETANAQLAKGLRISGTVTDDKNNNPVSGVSVNVYRLDQQYGSVAYGSTDPNGTYTTGALPPGNYKIQFSSYNSDYLSEWYEDRTDFSSATIFTLSDSNETANAQLAKGLRISGTVTDDKNNNPVSGVSVNVYRSDQQYGGTVTSGYTEQDGTYTTGALPPGNYKIQFNPYNSEYLSEWYQDQTDFNSATIFTPSDSNREANARLATGPRVVGKVVDEGTGDPIPNARVYVSSTTYWASASATTDNKGEFTTRALPPGDYKLQFSGPEGSSYVSKWFENKVDQNSATKVTLTDRDFTANASLSLGSRIKGTVLKPDATAATGTNVSVYAANNQYSNVASAYVDQDGAFQTQGLAPGKYKIQFFAPYPSNLLDEWYNDKRSSAEATVVELVTPGTDATANATLDQGSVLSGTVTAADGSQPLSDVGVSIYSRDGNHSSYARTHSDGKYTTSRALPPGEYRISFYSYDREYLGEYYNNKANASEADWVTLTLGTDEEINAALDKASHLVGKVTDPQGQPVANVQVRAYTNDYEYHGSSTDENGNYDIGGLRAGSYTLRFTPSEPTDLAPEWWNNQTDEYSADAIDLGAQQTLTNNVALDRGAVITGTVRDAQNRPVEGVTVKASGAESETAVTGADGTYRLVGLEAGSYRVRFKPLGDLTGQWYDGVDTKDGATLINLTSGQSQDGVDARLRTARTVGGTVIDPDGNPVSDVRIEIYAKGKSYYADRTVTDDQGTFRSHDLPAGDYDLYVRPSSPTRFASQWYDKAVTRSAATPVKVSDSQPATVTVKLEPGAEITGTVTGQGGTPIPGAYVSAERDRDYRYTQTDSAGNYTITGLTTGSYKVLFEPDTSEHVSEWYNNEESVEDADPVDVTQGRTTAGIDAQLARAGSISGTIRNSDGGPVAYSYVMAYRGDQQAGWSWVGSDGRYSFSGLRAGTYTMHSWGSGEWVAQWWNNKPDQASADRITLAAGEDLTGKDFTLSRGASISGTVKDSNGQTIDGYVELTDSDGEEYAGADVDNGAYSMVGLPAGTYYLQFQSYGSDWVSEWWQDKPDRRTATPITLSAGQVRSGFDAVLSQASKIRGTMIDGQGRAVRGCVTVFLTGSDDWAGSDCTDASGHYVVGGLRAGNYQVRFDPSSDKFARQWWNGAPRRAMASTITLGDASEAVADATLLAGGTLTGVVTDDAGDPVGGVQVRAYTQESYYETATVTDVHGRYVMQGLDDEDYRVQAAPGSSRLDLAGEWYDDKVNYATATVVPVQNGSTVTASFELEKGASISGKVSDESGPVSGIGVDVFDLDGNKSLTVWTDADGDYTSTALKPGQYKVRFMPGYYGGDGLVEQWWNNKNTEATANIIALSAKQQKTGVDATLRAIGPGNTAPGAPTDVQVTPGDKQVTVRWKAPPNDGGLPITRYVVEGTQDSGCVTLGNLVCMIEDLDNGESYTFTVKASNSVGLSPASTPSASVIPFGKPKPPTAVKATAGTEKATVSWTPGGDNGRAISGYTVTSSPSGKTCQTAATTCEVTGLTGGTSYTFTVKATNIAGNSADSAASNAVTPVANPTPPITPPTTPPPPGAPPQDPPPGGEPVNPGGGTQPPAPPAAPSAPAKVKAKSKSRKLAVSWSPVSGATKYQVRVNKGSKKGAWKTVSKPKYTSGKLKKGKYTVEVKAVGAGGGGPAKKVTVKVK